MLFNVYAEAIFSKALHSIEKGIKVNEEYINNIRYADHSTMMADNIEDLQFLVNRVVEVSGQFNLKVNSSKTTLMIVSRVGNTYEYAAITIDGQTIERNSSFKYLGSWLNNDWTSNQEVRWRIEIARSHFQKFKQLFNNRQLNLQLRLRLVKCYIWSVLLYGAESWTLKIADMNKLEAFEMWIYRRLLKITWVDHVSNEEVLRKMNKGRELLTIFKKRKTSYFGHVMRGDKYQLLQIATAIWREDEA